ncbi:MAG: alanine--tRNA ligase [Candidatus Moranbacteria bacterium]|nr:alanine--tRNA ligase [Candidatus Moranbacteria bacterium]MDD3964869.1 alanine--tRNA ligase [Candidatus Moranbacteria bacterium]
MKDIRTIYLEFFESKNHKQVPSSPLVPENDPTTLFTGSGMQPILPYLLGAKHPMGSRITDAQKCFRAQDIEEAGDNRHTTFFEMLGNWSFGDPTATDAIGEQGYFKQEQITWMWQFLTEGIGLDPKNLYFTCFRGNEDLNIPRDIESALLWQKLFREKGIEAMIGEDPEKNGIRTGEKIFYYSEKKNWWSRAGVPGNMPVGEPGGPDTEMFWDFGESQGLHEQSIWKDEPCHVNCDCGRFMEIGNNVFMEYKKTTTGFEKLAQKNVDFGGGLERLVAAQGNNPDMFLGYIFDTLRQTIEELSSKKYGENKEYTYAFRVVMDHIRASIFLIADGVVPSNTDQGYVLRRLLRRAVRYADILGISPQSLSRCVPAIIKEYAQAYGYLEEKKGYIVTIIDGEESKFRETLTRGMRELEKRLEKKSLTGKDAFELFSTYGFPLEMTEEMVNEKGVTLNREEFKKEFTKHQELSRSASAGKFKGGLADHSEMSVKYHTATHLLQQALRTVLGNHVTQKGSNITSERMRFDFSHPEKMTDEQKKEVENIVNEKIAEKLLVSYEDLPKEEAEKLGAIGLFEEKYGDKVRVYKIGAFSLEFCGGPHVANTGDLGHFKIMKEEACSAGVRRIKAILE